MHFYGEELTFCEVQDGIDTNNSPREYCYSNVAPCSKKNRNKWTFVEIARLSSLLRQACYRPCDRLVYFCLLRMFREKAVQKSYIKSFVCVLCVFFNALIMNGCITIQDVIGIFRATFLLLMIRLFMAIQFQANNLSDAVEFIEM